MDILMVAAELGPWVAETDTAGTVAALAKAVRQLGHEVTVAVPRYPGFEEAGLLVARRLTPLPLPGGGEVTVFDGQLPSGVGLVLFDAPVLFERPGVYGEESADYADNARRFGLLGRAAAAFVRQRAQQGKAFDVLHLFDWPGALAALALTGLEGERVPSVLTLTDPRRRPVFPASALAELGIPPELIAGAPSHELDVLALAAAQADTLTAPSPSLGASLGDPAQGGALERTLGELGKSVLGVLGGVDYALYNPATDPLIGSRYDAEEPSNKARDRTLLLRELGLELGLDAPLVAVLAEPGRDARLELALAALPALLRQELVLVLAGPGAHAPGGKLAALRERHADRLAVVDAGDEGFRHRLLAAADILVDPALTDASGRLIMAAQRYGAVPVARATLAARDAIVDCDVALETGTGFLFDDASPKAFEGAVARALAAWRSPGWARLRRRVMRLDLGWDRPARRYLAIYRQTLGAAAA